MAHYRRESWARRNLLPLILWAVVLVVIVGCAVLASYGSGVRQYRGAGVFERAEVIDGGWGTGRTVIHHSGGMIVYSRMLSIRCVRGKTYKFYADGNGLPVIVRVDNDCGERRD